MNRTQAYVAGWESACERYAAGESSEAIISAPTVNAWGYSGDRLYNYMGGVHGAIALIANPSDATPVGDLRRFNVPPAERRRLIKLTLEV